MDDASPPPALPPPLERRVRRFVHAPEHEAFAACAPGLEGVLAGEMRARGLADVRPAPGGAAFRGRLDAIYRANLWLRTASRIWVDVARFRARSPEDLVRHGRALPWDAWLPDLPLDIAVSSAGSRLTGSGRIEDALRDAIRLSGAGGTRDLGALAAGRGPGTEPEDDGDIPVQRLRVRIEDDHALLALDSSGPLLHRRGWRRDTGRAPLRETLAAGILGLAGYEGGPLVDPMCGSGTFPIEAALAARGLAPGAGREFLFQRWPSFRPATWTHLCRKAAEAALPRAPSPIAGRDVDPDALAAARSNAARAGVDGDVTLDPADFFDSQPPEGPPGLLVMNPPYGLRIAADGGAEALLRRIGHRIARAWPGWRFAIVVPDPRLVDALGLPVSSRPVLPHGGLRVAVALGRA